MLLPIPKRLPPADHPASPLRRLAAGPLLVCLDFDGTLAPIVARPDGAKLDPAMLDRLARLAALVPTAVVSGRDLGDLRDRVPIAGISMVGTHGVEIAHADGKVERVPGLDRSDARLGGLVERLRRATAALSGVLVEPKRHSVAVHWRLADPAAEAAAERIVDAAAEDYPEFRVGRGKMVAEFRPAVERDKGGAVALLRRSANGAVPAVLYIGDDVTDEDAFRVLDGHCDVGILVADPPRPSAAHWCVPDTDAVGALLDRLVAARAGLTASGVTP